MNVVMNTQWLELSSASCKRGGATMSSNHRADAVCNVFEAPMPSSSAPNASANELCLGVVLSQLCVGILSPRRRQS
jgi:hypothetical protein